MNTDIIIRTHRREDANDRQYEFHACQWCYRENWNKRVKNARYWTQAGDSENWNSYSPAVYHCKQHKERAVKLVAEFVAEKIVNKDDEVMI